MIIQGLRYQPEPGAPHRSASSSRYSTGSGLVAFSVPPVPSQRLATRYAADNAVITVSWSPCDCPPAVTAGTPGPAGHLAVYCNVKGCRSVWYRPRHEPARS